MGTRRGRDEVALILIKAVHTLTCQQADSKAVGWVTDGHAQVRDG